MKGIQKSICWYLDNQSWVEVVASGDYTKHYDEMYGRNNYCETNCCETNYCETK